jgi:outer membrane receptor protein involved in Fe transport
MSCSICLSAPTVGATEPSRPSHREGVELANYYRPFPGVVFDGDISWSRARFTDSRPAVGSYIPEAVGAVIAAGATIENVHGGFRSLRWRYFGPRPLVENDSVESKPTSLVELEAGYKISHTVRVALGIFNLLNAQDSDIDY